MKKSKQVAAGGIAASLCLLLMFLTGLFPFATYALPAMAGTLLIVVVIELGRPTATMVYAAVSLLSLLIAPDKEAALMFVVFFVFYPTLRGRKEPIRTQRLELFCHYVLFHGVVILTFSVISPILGMVQVTEELMEYGKWGIAALLCAANFMFFYFDKALTGLISAYIYRFRPKYIGKWK